MADPYRPRVPMSGAFGPNGEQLYTPEGTLVGADPMPSWYRAVQPYDVNPLATLEGLLMSTGVTGGPAGAVTGGAKRLYEAASASPMARYLLGAAGLGGAGAVTVAPSEAGGGSDDPRVGKINALQREIDGNRAKLEALAKTNLQSKTAREAASQPYLDAIRDASARKLVLESEIDAEEKKRANSSFAKSQPTLNEMWPAIQWGGPVAAAMLTRGAGNLVERGLNKPWRSAVVGAEKAIAKDNPGAARYQTGKAMEHAALEPHAAIRRGEDFLRETAIPTVAGAGVGMEAALFPYQYDRRNAPEGSAEREAAEKALGDDFWQSAKKGLVPGILGGFTGAHLPNVGPGYRPQAETTNLAKFLGMSDLPPQSGSALPGPRAPSGPAPLGPPPPVGRGLMAEPAQGQPLPLGASASQPSLSDILREPKLVDRMRASREAVPEPGASPIPVPANLNAAPPKGKVWVPGGTGSKLQDKKSGRWEKMPEDSGQP